MTLITSRPRAWTIILLIAKQPTKKITLPITPMRFQLRLQGAGMLQPYVKSVYSPCEGRRMHLIHISHQLGGYDGVSVE
ncbi:MAG: hypothetical protein ACK56F_10625, partial [bacterium]